VDSEQRRRALDLVRRVRDPTLSDAADLLDQLKRVNPSAPWIDLMFWTFPELSDDEVVDRSVGYGPIAL
jgi:hypothetical protein